MSPKPRKLLFIRLSSLGDVVLASSALQAPQFEKDEKHFLTSEEYSSLFQTHPSVFKLWTFRRRSGLRAWLDLCRFLENENFDKIYDLHSSTRTWILRIFLRLRHGLGLHQGPISEILVLKKSRFSNYGLFLFKKYFPKSMLAPSLLEQISRLTQSTKIIKADLRHLTDPAKSQPTRSKAHIGLMPSSLWKQKEWPLNKWLELCRALKGRADFVVFGTPADGLSLELEKILKSEGLLLGDSFVGKNSLDQVAKKIANADLFIGVDTGLCHLAQALSVPTLVIYGPTHESAGYPVWGVRSQAVGKKLWCRPCGKTGKYCVQILSPYKCLQQLESLELLSIVNTHFTSKAEL